MPARAQSLHLDRSQARIGNDAVEPCVHSLTAQLRLMLLQNPMPNYYDLSNHGQPSPRRGLVVALLSLQASNGFAARHSSFDVLKA